MHFVGPEVMFWGMWEVVLGEMQETEPPGQTIGVIPLKSLKAPILMAYTVPFPSFHPPHKTEVRDCVWLWQLRLRVLSDWSYAFQV